MPHHISPDQPARTSTAPYNFVPLPERVFSVEDGIKPWARHDEYVPATSSGWIDLDVAALTPLYIRGPARLRDGRWDDPERTRLRPDPFTTPDGAPAIPGSSLRGMTRNLVEILAFAKIQPVNRARPFFRDISPSRISTEYRRHFIEDLGGLSKGIDISTGQPVSQPAPGYRARVRAGLVRLADRTIRECAFARIERRLIEATLSGALYAGSGPMATPSRGLQHARLWVQADASEQNYFFHEKARPSGGQRHPDLYLRFRKVHTASSSQSPGTESGQLVITGHIQHKHLEFVFLDPPEEAAATVEIPEQVWERFHDEDQITQWQEQAFPKDHPPGPFRKAKGHVRDGEPVFFLTDDHGNLSFLGRAQMFRFPYDLSPWDLVPEPIRSAPLDAAEAMFGRVARTKEGAPATLKGRVFFEDAVVVGPAPAGGWYEDVVVPAILAAPKPTAFAHYLTQDGNRDARDLTTYLEGDRTTIRGHKLYWHRWQDGGDLSQIKDDKHDALLRELQEGQPKDTQHTIVRPVKSGTAFRGRVRFENLTDIELGALLSALRLPDGCAHKIGMAKPLGLGSVRIETRLRLVDRAKRYASWEADGVVDDDGRHFTAAFTQAMLDHAARTGETLLEGGEGLRRIARLDALFVLLQWRGRPRPAATASLDLARFRQRPVPVLPTPHAVAGHREPPWPKDAPSPRPSQERTRTAPRPALRRPTADRVRVQPVPQAPGPKPVEQGQTRPGMLQRRDARWIARFDGDDRDATILNETSIPADAADGSAAQFYIREQSKRGGIKVRFERLHPAP